MVHDGIATLVVLLATLAVSARAAGESFVAVSKFATPDDIARIRWDAITHIGQAINKLQVDAAGNVTPLDPATWPQQRVLVDAAHGNATKIYVGLSPTSKPDVAKFLASPTATLVAAAEKAAALAAAGGYDMVSIDIEGIKAASKGGLETFVAACGSALRKHSPPLGLIVTLYAPILVAHDSTRYNVTRLAELSDFVFIMGYDMTWLGAKPGSGAHEAGPNSPLDGLQAALDYALEVGAPAEKLLLALPMYGRVYACTGTTPPRYGNCSTATKNFQKKAIDKLAAATVGQPGCIHGWNGEAQSPFWDCPHGTNVSTTLPKGVRQQAWYDNPRSFELKIALASSNLLGGIGAWSESGLGLMTPTGTEIWDEFAAYVRGG